MSYNEHIAKWEDLVTTQEATRRGFIAIAFEKNIKGTPFVEEAKSLKIMVSKNCDQIFERLERIQKCSLPNFFRKKKKAITSWYSAITKASREAIEILAVTPNITS